MIIHLIYSSFQNSYFWEHLLVINNPPNIRLDEDVLKAS